MLCKRRHAITFEGAETMKQEMEWKTTSGVIKGETLVDKLTIDLKLEFQAENTKDQHHLTSILDILDEDKTPKSVMELLTCVLNEYNAPPGVVQ